MIQKLLRGAAFPTDLKQGLGGATAASLEEGF